MKQLIAAFLALSAVACATLSNARDKANDKVEVFERLLYAAHQGEDSAQVGVALVCTHMGAESATCAELTARLVDLNLALEDADKAVAAYRRGEAQLEAVQSTVLLAAETAKNVLDMVGNRAKHIL